MEPATPSTASTPPVTPTARRLALLAVAALIVYLCWLIVRPFVLVFLWAGVLAIVAYPAYLWIRRRGRSPTVAALATTLLVVLTVVIPATLTVVALWREAATAMPAIDQQVRQLVQPDSSLVRFAGRFVDVGPLLDPGVISARIIELRGVIVAWLVSSMGSILGALAQAILVVFTLFYFIRDAELVIGAMRGVVPLESEERDRIFSHVYSVISASVTGVLMIAALQGALGGIAFAMLGVPSPILWGIVMFLLSMIPLAGAFVVWAPVALYFFATGHYVKASFLTIWGIFAIGMLDNLLRPYLVGQKTKLHELVVFFAVLGGLQVFGMLGIIVGPVILAIGLAFADMLLKAPKRPDHVSGASEG